MRVSFTAFHRVQYFEQSIQSWSRVRGIDGVDVKVYLEPSPVEDEMTAVVTRLLPDASVHVNERREGVSRNPWNALNDAFGSEEFAILAEDDIIVSTDALEFFSWARDRFRFDDEVLAVCAFDSHLETVGHTFGPGDVTKQRWFSPLVWGTWRDRWQDRIRDTWDFDYAMGGWDWNMRLGVMGEDMFCVFPRQSRSTHIGELDGTHMQPIDFPQTQAGTFVEARSPARYRLVGYLDFWDGFLSPRRTPYRPERSQPPVQGFIRPPGTPGSNPNNPERKAIWQPPVPLS